MGTDELHALVFVCDLPVGDEDDRALPAAVAPIGFEDVFERAKDLRSAEVGPHLPEIRDRLSQSLVLIRHRICEQGLEGGSEPDDVEV